MIDSTRSARSCACAVTAGVLLASAGAPALGQELYRNELASGMGWGVNATSADHAATFGYNYSANGIPEAPNSRGGDVATRGLKMEANLGDPNSTEAFTAYPLGQNFTGRYRLRFDAWMNYDAHERINGASNATTEFLGGGIGYDSTSADIGSGYQMIFTGDGGSGSDWRAFADGSFLDPGDMVANDRNGFNAHYSDFLPGVAPPLGQAQNAFPPGTAGSPGFQWITVEFDVRPASDRVLVTIEKPGGDRLPIVSFDTSAYPGVSTDGNIGLFYADFFTSVTLRPDLTFGIIDNVLVEVPAPGAASVLGFAALALVRRRPRSTV